MRLIISFSKAGGALFRSPIIQQMFMSSHEFIAPTTADCVNECRVYLKTMRFTTSVGNTMAFAGFAKSSIQKPSMMNHRTDPTVSTSAILSR